MKRKEEQIEKCEYIHVHEDIVEKVNEQMPEEDKLYDLADFFKVFADSTRIKILYVLKYRKKSRRSPISCVL